MPILIAVVAVLLVMMFAMGGTLDVTDESVLFLVVGLVVLLFAVLFFLPYFREFNRSEASRKRIRQFRKKGRVHALRFMALSIVAAVSAVWWLRSPPPAAPVVAAVSAVPVVPPVATVAADTAHADIQKSLTAWAAAWSDGEVDAYLAAYAADFVPADGGSRKAWEAQRRQRVDKGRGIVVKVNDLRITTQGAGRATAVFVQHYSARGLVDVSTKTLRLERQGGQWRIVHESAVAQAKTP